MHQSLVSILAKQLQMLHRLAHYDLWYINQVVSTQSVNQSQWKHLAVTCDGTTYRLYINGILDGVNSFAGANEGANATDGERPEGGSP